MLFIYLPDLYCIYLSIVSIFTVAGYLFALCIYLVHIGYSIYLSSTYRVLFYLFIYLLLISYSSSCVL